MELSINSRNLEVTTRLRNYVEKKTSRLDRYMPDLTMVSVDLSEVNAKNAQDRQVAQITIRDKRGTILRAEERSSDLFAAIDAVVDKLYRQINKYRGKRKRKWRSSGSKEELIFGFVDRLSSLTKNFDREAFGLCDTYAYKVTEEDQTDVNIEQAYHQMVATLGQEETDLINAYIELKIEQELQNHEKKRPDYPFNQRFTGR